MSDSPKNFLRVELTDEQWEYIQELKRKYGRGYISPWVRDIIEKEMNEDINTLKSKEDHYQMKLEEIKAKKSKLLVAKQEPVKEADTEKQKSKREIGLKLIEQAKAEPDIEAAKMLCIRAYKCGITLTELRNTLPGELYQKAIKKINRQV